MNSSGNFETEDANVSFMQEVTNRLATVYDKKKGADKDLALAENDEMKIYVLEHEGSYSVTRSYTDGTEHTVNIDTEFISGDIPGIDAFDFVLLDNGDWADPQDPSIITKISTVDLMMSHVRAFLEEIEASFGMPDATGYVDRLLNLSDQHPKES